MFRIGSALFVPAYLTVTLYRPFASANDDGSVALMAGACYFALGSKTNLPHSHQHFRSARKSSGLLLFPSLIMDTLV